MWPFKHKLHGLTKHIKERLVNTPDYWQLEQKARHLVFWYFSPSPHFHTPIGEEFMSGFTKHMFVLWKKKQGYSSFPIPLLHKLHGITPARICGGLHFVSPRDMISLDKAMRNGVEFHRTKLPVVVPYEISTVSTKACEGRFVEEVTHSHVKHYMYSAFIYIGLKSVWEKELDGGYHYSPVRRYNMPKLGDYYKWSAEETER